MMFYSAAVLAIAQALAGGGGTPPSQPTALVANTAEAGSDVDASADSKDDGAIGIRPAGSTKNDGGMTRGDNREDQKWIDRWSPEANTGELGAYGGVFLAGDRHEVFEADESIVDQGHKTYDSAAGALGARLGYYPSRFFGIEGEGGAMFASTGDERATLWTARGNLVAQLGLWSVTPFLSAGGGAFGVSSSADAVGNDVDAALHYGGGLKVFASRRTQVRVDVRDVLGSALGVDAGLNHNLEATLGISMVLGRKDEARPAPVAVVAEGPGDRDGDGVLDPNDACIDEPGTDPNGCPPLDSDGDGVLDAADACVDEPGDQDDGCPNRDADRDGILDADDSCVDEPETANGFEDSDGCPDEIPAEVQAFEGVMEGIVFDTAKSTIKSKSRANLDEAVATLTKYPELRIEILGHTDDRGVAERNQALSEERAAAVRDYLVKAGIDADRISTRGVGSAEPRADNATSKGRASNRRIEFRLR